MRKKEDIASQREYNKIIRAKIREKGLLYKYVAQHVKVTPVRFSQYLNNDRQMPSDVWLRIAKFLDIKLAE